VSSEIQNLISLVESGNASIEIIEKLSRLYGKRYKSQGKTLNDYADWQLHIELLRKLKSELNTTSYSLNEITKIEYHNTKVFMNSLKMIIGMSESAGDVSQPQFYGQPDTEYTVTMESIIHIVIRHNETINNFVSLESKENGYNPSSFGFGILSEPMLLLFMALRVLKKDDWKKAAVGKNLIAHIAISGKKYTIIRVGESKRIKSFYPRNDDNRVSTINLKRYQDKMEFYRLDRDSDE